MNEGANKATIARRKNITYHFIEGNNLNGAIIVHVGLVTRVFNLPINLLDHYHHFLVLLAMLLEEREKEKKLIFFV